MASDLLIEDCPLTKTWLCNVIQAKIGVKPTVDMCTTLDNADLGYMSMIRKVDLVYNDDDLDNHSNLPKSVVVKIANGAKGSDVMASAFGDNSDRSENVNLMETFMHNTECNYYKLFSKYNTKPLRVPAIYKCVDTRSNEAPIPVIVMEMFENCRVYDICQGFNESQLYKIVDELVKLHFFSFTTSGWKSIEMEPEMKASVDMFTQTLKIVAEKVSEQPGMEIIKVFLRNTFEKNINFFNDFAEEYLQDDRPSVIVHGDLWAPQILWNKDDDIAGIIDWQIAHRGSPVEDFQHVISTCTSVQNRKTLTKPLLDYYHSQLSEKLRAQNIKMPYTREELDEEYRRTLLHSAAITIFANGFWANSPVLQTDGNPDMSRIMESFGRCRSFIEHTIEMHNMK